MANKIFSGSEGAVYVGSTAVASIRSFSIEETQETIDATTMNTSGVAFRTNKPTFKSWSGTVDVFWTIDDANSSDNFSGDPQLTHIEQGGPTPGDAAGATGDENHFGILQPGSTEVELHFWPSGDSKGELGYQGKCLITSRSISTSVDGMVEASITVTGTDPIRTETGQYTGLAA